MANHSLSQMVYPELKTTGRLNVHGATNFHLWKNKLDFVLFDNNVKYVLTEPIPDKRNDAVAYKKFLDDDFRARHIILGCLHDDLNLAFHHHQSAKSLLKALTSFFAESSVSKTTRLWVIYRDYKMLEKRTRVNEHCLKMRLMVTELGFMGLQVSEYEQKYVLIKSLPGKWDLLTSILLFDLDSEKGLSLEDVEQRARDYEACLRSCPDEEDEEDEESSDMGFRPWQFQGTCYNCGGFDHRTDECPLEDVYDFYW